MDSVHLTQREFFDKLEELFNQKRGAKHGAIYLVQKRLSFDQVNTDAARDNELSDIHVTKPMPIIVRASNGKSKSERVDKIKMSTIVQPHDIDAFYLRYADICKSGMAALKPRDRSKKKAKAKKKKILG
ncbi:hypothetical protein QQS21_001872 [Conoideocrella luteorostrata]|uniref:Signal recognition particle subunit SRP14 n=1 Tax=Conoideocrella luteorostrata TaxID=1105319 RepID=A0AAJ0D051_9HYPO|nr:hypothetical protein QQS21_001872 [Conoideocrella luteorostrata]